MASFSEARENPVDQLWNEIDDVHAGMLGIVGSDLTMRPMAPQADRSTHIIWFFTRTATPTSSRRGTRAVGDSPASSARTMTIMHP